MARYILMSLFAILMLALPGCETIRQSFNETPLLHPYVQPFGTPSVQPFGVPGGGGLEVVVPF